MYYLFSPLLDKDGNQARRVPESGDYFLMNGDLIMCNRLGEFIDKFYILVMREFEEDPLGPIKWAYGAYKYCSGEALDDIPRGFAEILWQAIVKTMEKAEGK